MLEKFNSTLINQNDHLLIAVSGGIDSMVLLHYLNTLKQTKPLKISVAHVDHDKRNDSAKDKLFVQKICVDYNIDFYTIKLNLDNYENFHDYARTKRYDFFVETANKINANKIVLAHNLNDNVETILMRLTRGSSFEGYRGILSKTTYKNLTIIRPLISVSRQEIVDYQTKNNIDYNEDSSNKKDDYTRNRYRHHILPLLAEENPKFLNKYEQFSNYQIMAYDLIDKLSKEFLKKNIKQEDDGYSINIIIFNKLDQILQYDIVKKIVNLLTNNSVELSYKNIQDIISLFHNKKPHVELKLANNLYIYKSYKKMYFFRNKPEFANYEFVVDDFKEIKLPDGSLVRLTKNPNKYYDNIYKLCYNNLDFIFPLTIRNRRDGDKVIKSFSPKKIKDLFIKKKIPMRQRNQLPIILDNSNKILWIPSVYKAQTYGNNNIYLIYQEAIKNA